MLISQHCSLRLRSLRYCWNWLGKGMLYSEFAAISRSPSRNFTRFSHNFMQFWIYQPFLGKFQYVGYQIACTQAEKFNGDAFTHFHTLPCAISCNFHTILAISAIRANSNMLGTKMQVNKLKNSMVILSHTFIHSLTQFHPNFGADKFIGGTGRGQLPPKGDRGPKKEVGGL